MEHDPRKKRSQSTNDCRNRLHQHCDLFLDAANVTNSSFDELLKIRSLIAGCDFNSTSNDDDDDSDYCVVKSIIADELGPSLTESLLKFHEYLEPNCPADWKPVILSILQEILTIRRRRDDENNIDSFKCENVTQSLINIDIWKSAYSDDPQIIVIINILVKVCDYQQCREIVLKNAIFTHLSKFTTPSSLLVHHISRILDRLASHPIEINQFCGPEECDNLYLMLFRVSMFCEFETTEHAHDSVVNILAAMEHILSLNDSALRNRLLACENMDLAVIRLLGGGFQRDKGIGDLAAKVFCLLQLHNSNTIRFLDRLVECFSFIDNDYIRGIADPNILSVPSINLYDTVCDLLDVLLYHCVQTDYKHRVLADVANHDIFIVLLSMMNWIHSERFLVPAVEVVVMCLKYVRTSRRTTAQSFGLMKHICICVTHSVSRERKLLAVNAMYEYLSQYADEGEDRAIYMRLRGEVSLDVRNYCDDANRNDELPEFNITMKKIWVEHLQNHR